MSTVSLPEMSSLRTHIRSVLPYSVRNRQRVLRMKCVCLAIGVSDCERGRMAKDGDASRSMADAAR